MKKSVLSVAAVLVFSLANLNAQAQSVEIINGTNPRPQTIAQQPQIINGTNPRPQIINGTNPRPQDVTPSTSVVPAWVQTVLIALHIL